MRRIILLTVSIAVLLTTVVGPATVQGGCFRHGMASINGLMNIRQSHSTRSAIVRVAAAGESFAVSSSTRTSSYCWLNVQEGWMAWTERVTAFQPGQTSTTAKPTTHPANIDNCCFVNRQCTTDQQWEDGFWAFQNGQCPVPAQTQTQTSTQPVSVAPAQINNCCFVDRQCATEKEWEEGWRAWGRLECPIWIENCCQLGWECHTEADRELGARAYGALGCGNSTLEYARTHFPAVLAARKAFLSVSVVIAPFSGPIPAGVDNCCFVNWQCDSEQDYVYGYERFQHNLCYVPSIEGGIRLEGSDAFRSRIREALQLLLDGSSYWYAYSVSGLTVIRERPGRNASVTSRTGIAKFDAFRYRHLLRLAAVIVHEACHVHRYRAGLEPGGYIGEKDCEEKERRAEAALDAAFHGRS